MNIEEQKKAISLFFFYSLMDEELAVQASSNAIRQGYKKLKNLKKENKEEELRTSNIVHLTHKFWLKNKDKKIIRPSHQLLEAGWQLNDGVEIGLWRHFIREAEPEEYLTAIWSQILNFSDEDIAAGLGVTVGTVRHRTARAIKRLGTMMQAGA